MPIIWRYLLFQFTKVLLLSTLALVTITSVSQLEVIAEFATFGSQYSTILLFALYQILFVLPVIIPITCLIASKLLYRQLSQEQVLTTLRSGGISIGKILAPILLLGIMIAIANFVLISEISTHAHLTSRKMARSYAAKNPLLMLKSSTMLKNQKAYVNMTTTTDSKNVKDVIVISNNKQNQCLNYFSAKKLKVTDNQLIGKQTFALAPKNSMEKDGFDSVSMENTSMFSMPIDDLMNFKNTGYRVSNDYLQLKSLLIKMKKTKSMLKTKYQPELRDRLDSCISEIARRISIALATFAFILMGAAYGIEISRGKSMRNLLAIIILAVLTITSFIIAKENTRFLTLSLAGYIIPNIVIILLSISKLRKINRGLA